MKKTLLLSLFATALLSSEAELLKRIEALEKELNTLKSMALEQFKEAKETKTAVVQNTKKVKLIPKIKIAVQDNTLDIQEALPIIEQNERKSILDKINLSPEVEIRADDFHYKVSGLNDPTRIYRGAYAGQLRRTGYSKDFDIATSIKFRLYMDAAIDDTLSFKGNLLYANSSQSNERVCILSRDIKSVSSSSAFDVERAYIDYTPNKSSPYAFTLSAGLLPTTGGTPMQYAQDGKRKSMFPALVFDMNTYGLIGTQKLGDDTYIRAIAAKGYTLRDNFYPYQCNRENIDNANVFGIYGDTKFKFLGNSLLSFGVNMLHDFKAHPYLGPDINADNADKLGNIFTFGLGIDIDKFANQDMTVFLHTALSSPDGNGHKDDYQILSDTDAQKEAGLTKAGYPGFSVADYAQGDMISDTGYSIYLGGKYDITNTINIGAEYNHGSKYWFSATQGAEDMYNKLATRGHVSEVYGMWKFHKNLYTKIGYMYSKENYTGSGWHFGEPASKNGTQKVGYMSLKAKF